MPVSINEVRSEVHAFDATTLVNDEVLALITRRVADELVRMRAATTDRDRDTTLADRGRAGD